MAIVEGVRVDAETGSATSWGRHPDQAWLVRVSRGDRSVIVAWGLTRNTAEGLAQRIMAVLACAGLCRPGGQCR
jgi:hypothetical protein